MVEELIAEGRTPDEVVDFVMTNLGLSEADALLYVNTALGGTGDVVMADVDALIAGSWDSRTVLEPGYGDEMPDPNDWSVTATGWAGETLPVEIEVEEPALAVVAAAEDHSGAMALGALLAGVGQKFGEMMQAITALGNRPVVVEMPQELTAAMTDRPSIIVNVPEQPPAQITVEQPAITVEAPNVNIEPAQITVETPAVTVEVAAAEVVVPTPNVNVTVENPSPTRKITFERDPGTGRIESAEVEDE